MLIELHLLTSHAPSNLNRDDFGRPKTAYFGGTERGRISSQSQKRALRLSPPLLAKYASSDRSKEYPLHFFNLLSRKHAPADDARLLSLCEFFGSCVGAVRAVSKTDSRKLMIEQAIMLTNVEREAIERVLSQHYEAKTDPAKADKDAKKAKAKLLAEMGLNERPTDRIDLALFGRMTTDDANSFTAVDAAMQVAHPIATHTTLTETDYFTAVDDLAQKRGERGSAHIDEAEFNSAVYYKYFSCNLDALAANLGGDRAAALAALEAVLDAACRVTPTGKQNTFASHSQADAALLVVREANVPCSLANAFERPVPASDDGYTARSVREMMERYCRLVRGYEMEDAAALFTVESGGVRLSDEKLRECFEKVEQAERLRDLWAFLRRHAGSAPVEG